MSSRRAQLIACLEKGLHYFSIGQFVEARAFWEKALELDPQNAQAREFMQYVSEETQNTPAAPSRSPNVTMPATSQPSAKAQAPHHQPTKAATQTPEAHHKAPSSSNHHTAAATSDGTAPFKDLSTQHIPFHPDDLHSPSPEPTPIATQDHPIAPPKAGPVHNFMAPSPHNIEDLLVPASQSDLPQVSQHFHDPAHMLGNSGLMPPSLGAFSSLAPEAVSLLDQSGANPLFGDEAPAPLPSPPTSSPSHRALPNPDEAFAQPTQATQAAEPTPHESFHANQDLSTRLLPILPNKSQVLSELISSKSEPEPPLQHQSARSTMPPVSSTPVIQDIETLAPKPAQPSRQTTPPINNPSRQTTPPTPRPSAQTKAHPAHSVSTKDTDTKLKKSGEHRITTTILEQAPPQKLSPVEISQLIDVEEGQQRKQQTNIPSPPPAPAQDLSTNDYPADAMPGQDFHPHLPTPPPIEVPPLSPSSPFWDESIEAAPSDGFEDTPSDEFPAANETLLSNEPNDPYTNGLNASEWNADEQSTNRKAPQPHSQPQLSSISTDSMESPTPSHELSTTDNSPSLEDAFPHEGSQLEFTGLPELPTQSFQEAGQVISFDLQGSDEPYIPRDQYSPILTYRSQSPDVSDQPPSEQPTGHDFLPYTPPQDDFGQDAFGQDAFGQDAFDQQDPFQQPYEDPFSTPGKTDLHANPYAASASHYEPSNPYQTQSVDPYQQTQNAPYQSDAHPSQTPSFDPYGQTPDPAYEATFNVEYGQPYHPNQEYYPNASYGANNDYSSNQHSYDNPYPGHDNPPEQHYSNDYSNDDYSNNNYSNDYNDDYQPHPAQSSHPEYASNEDANYDNYDPHGQQTSNTNNHADPYAQTMLPGSPYHQEPHVEPYIDEEDTPTPATAEASGGGEELEILDLEQVFDDDEGVFEDDPTPDAPMPSIHQQIAHLPSAALRHEYVEHATPQAPDPTPSFDELSEVGILLTGAKDLLREEDYRSAIELLEMAKNLEPKHPEVIELYARCKAEVEKIYLSEITSLELVPHVKCTMEEIMRLNIDHRVGFLISQIDGHTSLSDLIILTGFEETEVVSMIGQLNDQGVLHLE